MYSGVGHERKEQKHVELKGRLRKLEKKKWEDLKGH